MKTLLKILKDSLFLTRIVSILFSLVITFKMKSVLLHWVITRPKQQYTVILILHPWTQTTRWNMVTQNTVVGLKGHTMLFRVNYIHMYMTNKRTLYVLNVSYSQIRFHHTKFKHWTEWVFMNITQHKYHRLLVSTQLCTARRWGCLKYGEKMDSPRFVRVKFLIS